MKKTVRKPIIRKAIILTGEKFLTIASHNQNYEPCHVMGTYASLEEARANYVGDMNALKKSGEQYQHYAIRKVVPESKED